MLKSTGSVDILRFIKLVLSFSTLLFPVFWDASALSQGPTLNIWPMDLDPSGLPLAWEMSLYVFVFHCVSGKLEAAGNVLHKNDQEWSLSRTDLPQVLRTASIGASFSVLDTSSRRLKERWRVWVSRNRKMQLRYSTCTFICAKVSPFYIVQYVKKKRKKSYSTIEL